MRRIAYIFILLCCLTSCSTEVELCDVQVHPHRYELNVDYQFESGAVHPDSMYIFANRIFNTIRYQFSYNLLTEEGKLLKYLPNKGEETDTDTDAQTSIARNGDEGTGTGDDTGTGDNTDGDNGDGTTDDNTGDTESNEGDNEGNVDEETTPDENEEETEPQVPVFTDFSVRAGQYQILTINQSESFVLDSVNYFMSDALVQSSVLGITYRRYSRPQYQGQSVEKWVDFNQGYDFVQDAGPIYYDMQAIDTETGGNMNIVFKPQAITQEITFNFNVKLNGKGLTLDSIRGEVSGVCAGMGLFTRYLDMDAIHSCRTVFHADMGQMSGDSIVPCTATVYVPSLINSEDENMKTGPGIIYLTASVKATDEDGTEVFKTCYAGINLRKYLLEQPLTKLADGNGIHHVITEQKVVINIEPMFPIYREEILQSTEPEGNIDYWFQEEDGKGDHDIEV